MPALVSGWATGRLDSRPQAGGSPHPASNTDRRGLHNRPGHRQTDFVRMVLLNHSYHHRGQLSVYLRLLDVPVPPIYGRSADEDPFA